MKTKCPLPDRLFPGFLKRKKKFVAFFLVKLAFKCVLYILLSSSTYLGAQVIPDSIFHQNPELTPAYTAIGIIPGASCSDNPNRIFERNTSYGVGFANVFDTYLSPQAYKGVEIRILRETMPLILPSGTTSDTKPWLRQSVFQGFGSYTEHPSGDNTSITLMGEWRWGYLYHFHIPVLPAALEILAGGQLYGEGGMIYNMANGNNPVAMKLGAGAGITGMALYRFGSLRKPLSVRYQFFAPVLGAFFSPHYGQSYYEIFSLGNSEGVVRFSSLHNKPSLWQQISLDFQVFRKNTIRFSYVADIRQSDVNHLKYHQWSHIFMLGLVHRFQRL